MKKKYYILIAVLLILILAAFAYFKFFSNNGESLAFDSLIIKASIKSDGSLLSSLKVTNLLNEENNVKISLNELGDFINASESDVSLSSRESKSIGISFSNLKKMAAGIYTGSLAVSDLTGTRKIPVVLEIESDVTLFDSAISLFPSENVNLGEKLNAEVRIFDLAKTGLSHMDVSYFIKDFENNVLYSDNETLVVNNQVMLTKSVDLPSNLAQGSYLFGVTVKYQDSFGTSSIIFTAVKQQFLQAIFDKQNIMILILFALVIFALIFFIFYSAYTRDRLIRELKMQYGEELKKHGDNFRRKEKENENSSKTREEKTRGAELLRKMRRERELELKRIHLKRIEKIRQLRKDKKDNEIKSHMAQWKKGYGHK
jgi:hypothetical protein